MYCQAIRNTGQIEQRRGLSELYKRMTKPQPEDAKDKDVAKDKAAVKDKEAVKDMPQLSISSIPKPKIRVPRIDPNTMARAQAPKELPKDPKLLADEYIADLHSANWGGEETWVRFSRLPQKSHTFLRDIDINCTLANIRGTERALSRRGRSTPTSNTLSRMLEVFEAAKLANIVPDRYTYQELIAINVDLLNFNYAHDWLEKMVVQGIKPTIRPYRTILKGYSTVSSELDSARRLWHEIKTKIAAGLIAGEKSDEVATTVDLLTYTSYVAAESKAGNFALVVGVLEEMDQAGIKPDITLRNTVLDGLVRHKGLDAGLQEAELMEQSGYELNGYSYTTLLNATIKEQRDEEIHKLLEAAAAKNIVPPAYLMQKLTLDPFDVLSIMAKLEASHKVRLYNVLIESAMRGNDFTQVLQLIDHLKQNNVPANVVTYTLLFDALNKAGRLDQAKSMFTKVFSSGELTPDAHIYSIMIDACGRHGDVKTMFWFKNEMQRQGLAVSEPVYNSILSALSQWRNGNLQAVMVTASEMERVKPTVKPTCRTFSAIFAAFATQAQRRRLGLGELEFLQTWYAMATDKYYVAKDSYYYFMAVNAFVCAQSLPDAMTAFSDMVRSHKVSHVSGRFMKNPVRMLDLIKLAIEHQEYGAALEIWNNWQRLRLPPISKAVELALFACDQMGQPTVAINIIRGLLSMDEDVYCPQFVDESVLALYIAMMTKHSMLDAIMPVVHLWTTAMTAECGSEPVLSESTVAKTVAMLRGNSHPGAAAIANELLTHVDAHFPDATPV
ncbi:hypothetical protein IW139_002406 [Coemansia sp. RSA 353]|nr:hypothetical protein IW142_001279 [Coemansia sp. RSA 564]KAJ2224114.1 hypothetical protein IW143_000703 [Coemansia sp. RSA 520]KAJ2298210.1 hypothetical protein IW139_002406 [Coemansia sp. RSA 353]KAJ2409553.1 hypothetical protein J3F80_001213 [Coemansia sp. RSA 2526]